MFDAVIIDFSWISILLLVAYFIRAKVSVLQKLYIPVSVIAGLLGLILGPNVLGLVSPVYIHWSDMIGSYATPLLAIVFSVQFFGIKFDKRLIKNVSTTYLIYGVVIFIQVLGAFPIVRAFHLPDGLSLLPQSAFYGGHGIPAIVGSIFDSCGYWDGNEAISIGTTFATIGLIYGVVMGVTLINIGSRKGWLVRKGGLGQLSEEELTGYITPEKRDKMMVAISHSSVIDPLAVHVALVGFMMLLAYGLLALCQRSALLKNFAVTVTIMVVALAFGLISNKTRLKNIVDRNSLQRIGATALEYLIASSVATTNLNIVITYGLPIAIISVVLLAVTTVVTLALSKAWLNESWFEHAICMFGAFTGVTATGMMLLRIADPDVETSAMVDIAAVSPFNSLTLQTCFLQFAPLWVVTTVGCNRTMIGTGIALVLFLIIGFVCFGRKK